MTFNIYFPWGAGIGTLGFRFKNHYVDFAWVNGGLQKFVANYVTVNDESEKFHWTDRSWYRLMRDGWKLVKREDRWGTWSNGHHRPTLRERPAEPLQRALALRKYFPLYEEIDWYGEKLEVISFPCPGTHDTTIMLRQFNRPGTMREVVLEEYV